MPKPKLTPAQSDVLSVLDQYGPLPDHALVPLAQHVTQTHQSSSGIRTRRAELCAIGMVEDTQRTVRMPSGRHAHVYAVKP